MEAEQRDAVVVTLRNLNIAKRVLDTTSDPNLIDGHVGSYVAAKDEHDHACNAARGFVPMDPEPVAASPFELEVYEAEDGFRWHALGENGEVILVSTGEAFARKGDATKAMNAFEKRGTKQEPE